MSDIVDILREDKRCLVRMAEHAALAGDTTSVRVEDPVSLVVSLEQAASEITRLRSELARLELSNQTGADELGNEIGRLQRELESARADQTDKATAWDYVQKARDEARAKAFEDAAQIAESLVSEGDADEELGGDDWLYRTTTNRTATGLASALRARAQEGR